MKDKKEQEPREIVIPLGYTGPKPIVKDGTLEFYYETGQAIKPKK